MQPQKTQWNEFVIQNNGSFLQSFEWGQFQELLGYDIWRTEIVGLRGLIIKYPLPFGKSYLYCPRGPLGKFSEDVFRMFLGRIEEIAQREKSIFFKTEPERDINFSDINFSQESFSGTEAKSKGFSLVASEKQIQPSKTIILDITKPEEELLQTMHQKTRYNIRLAQRKGIVVEKARGSQMIDIFFALLKETARRDRFHSYPKEYYRKMTEVLEPAGLLKLFLARHGTEIVAVNLVCFFNQTATYLHGASDYRFRHLMAPYLLQWQTILEAKKTGMRYYDLWGIDDEKWPGVTRFKRGFGGEEVFYPGAYDAVFQPAWYRLYNFARKIL
jgi:lipid II:glycine glycyltransferase (peptidoglycan interpeptide bridge formation enzyme)